MNLFANEFTQDSLMKIIIDLNFEIHSVSEATTISYTQPNSTAKNISTDSIMNYCKTIDQKIKINTILPKDTLNFNCWMAGWYDDVIDNVSIIIRNKKIEQIILSTFGSTGAGGRSFKYQYYFDDDLNKPVFCRYSYWCDLSDDENTKLNELRTQTDFYINDKNVIYIKTRDIINKEGKKKKIKRDTTNTIIDFNTFSSKGKYLIEDMNEKFNVTYNIISTQLSIYNLNIHIPNTQTDLKQYLLYVDNYSQMILKASKLSILESSANILGDNDNGMAFIQKHNNLFGDNIVLLEREYDKTSSNDNAVLSDQYYFDYKGNLILVTESKSTPVYSETYNINGNDDQPKQYNLQLIKHYYRDNKNILNTDGNNKELKTMNVGWETKVSRIIQRLREYLKNR